MSSTAAGPVITISVPSKRGGAGMSAKTGDAKVKSKIKPKIVFIKSFRVGVLSLRIRSGDAIVPRGRVWGQELARDKVWQVFGRRQVVEI